MLLGSWEDERRGVERVGVRERRRGVVGADLPSR